MNTRKIPEWILRDAVEDCNSVEEFAHRYRKPYRFTGKGADHAQLLIQSHHKEIEQYGYTCIGKQESVTGKFECYVPDLQSLRITNAAIDTQASTQAFYSIHQL